MGCFLQQTVESPTVKGRVIYPIGFHHISNLSHFLQVNWDMYIISYIYIYIHMYVCMYIYIYHPMNYDSSLPLMYLPWIFHDPCALFPPDQLTTSLKLRGAAVHWGPRPPFIGQDVVPPAARIQRKQWIGGRILRSEAGAFLKGRMVSGKIWKMALPSTTSRTKSGNNKPKSPQPNATWRFHEMGV